MSAKPLIKRLLMRVHAWVEGLLFLGHSKRVFIPSLAIKVGGPVTFMSLLSARLKSRGWKITRNRYTACRCVLIPIAWDTEQLTSWKQSSKRRIIQRIDGLFYDKRGNYDPSKNAEASKLYLNLADVVVFQSDYSQQQCQHFLGSSCASDTRIIRNGTDWMGSRKIRRQGQAWKFISTGNFRDVSMLCPIVEALKMLEISGVALEWTVVGPVDFEGSDAILQKPFVKHIPVCPRPKIRELLEQAHIFLFSFLNPACPNSVIEAIGCALPVVSFDSGSLKELCSFSEDLLAKTGDKTIHEAADLSADAFREVLDKCMLHYDRYSALAFEHKAMWGIDSSVDAYEKLLLESI